MIVISDASAIIALATINHLRILKELYTEIIIPQAVFEEIAVAGIDRPGSREIGDADWIRAQSVSNFEPVKHLNLGDGETEAIALALELGADLLLLDEIKARREAKRLGVRFVGLLGILVEAKARNKIEEVKPVLDALQNEAGFRIGQTLYNHVLESVDEQ